MALTFEDLGMSADEIQAELQSAGRDLFGGEPVESLSVNFLDPSGKRKLQRLIKGGNIPGVSPDTGVKDLGSIDILTLSHFGFKRGDFTRGLRRKLGAAGRKAFFVGKQMKPPESLAKVLPRSLVEDVGPGLGVEAPPVTRAEEAFGAMRDLERHALEQIQQGTALAGGDFTSELGQQQTQLLQERIGSAFAARGFGAAPPAHESLIVDEYLRNLGRQMVGAGTGFLGTTNPMAFPEAQMQRADLLFSRGIFNRLTTEQSRLMQQMHNLATPGLGKQFEQGLPGFIYGAGGGLLGGAGGSIIGGAGGGTSPSGGTGSAQVPLGAGAGRFLFP